METIVDEFAASLLQKAQINDVDGEMEEKSDEIELGFTNRAEDDLEVDDAEEDEETEIEEEEEFSFVSVGSDFPTVSAAADGEIQTFFPLFDQSLLYALDRNDLPYRPPVKNVFIETEDSFSLKPPPPSSADDVSGNDKSSGPYCAAVEASPQICKKSNSTGFSRLWRVQDLVKRSNSDGRDAFVFLNDGSSSSSAKKQVASSAAAAGGQGKTLWKAKKSTKGKSAAIKAHEKYLKNREEDKRKTYLPYRPELMGFFTNIHGGLSRNVHPF